MRITLRQSSSAGARIDLSCGLCHLIKPVLMPTSVHLAFQWRFLADPVCLYLSQIIAVHPSILFLIFCTSSENWFSRSRWHSQIAFPTVLMFFLVTQVRNCEDSRILNDLHRITILPEA
ncbi:hypothetical protein T07_4827 [Trichinella nelsoni]|uniref:Uncharacterized protein n=1 Tax=Trichinella nelsoni TaxID=6336 RepID=A0A0V0RFA6_9BILA|nr:hypothetical protein T07_4827 [Trichinella nelsoni]